MRRKTVKLVALALPAALGVGAIARPTSAKDSAYTFTMALRAVSGEDNKQFHDLTEGDLTVTGEIWVTEKKAQSTATPNAVTIEIRKRGSYFSTGPMVCSFTVMPAVAHFQRRAYNHSCPRIVAGSYVVFISKAINGKTDGWTLQGSGTLKNP